MSAAAHELGIAQPALSKQVLQLEHELEVTLFERHSRGVTLTKAGEKLREEAAELMRRFDAIKLSVRQSEAKITGKVKLAVISSLAPALAVDLYPRIERDYPNISLHVVDSSSTGAGNALLRQEADLAVIPNAGTDLPQAQSVPLFEETFYFISGKSARGPSTPILFAEAASHPLVLPFHQHDLRRRLEDTARRSGVSLNVKYETGSINVIGEMVVQGLANAIVPISHWLGSIGAGRVTAQPVIGPSVSRVHSLCWLPDRTMSPATQAVSDMLRVGVQALVSGGKLSGTVVHT